MEIMKHKKVELTELFYDLVYVYAISQITELLHHFHNGNLSSVGLFEFSLGMIIYVNSWMVQTVFTNRFGKNSLLNVISMFTQMLLLLISSTAITNEWNHNFYQFILPMAGISLILLIQYIWQYFHISNIEDKNVIRPFFYILGIRTLALSLSALLPYRSGLVLATLGILFTWILPGLIVNKKVTNQTTPINFAHLIERLSLLVIITFGEMIIDITPAFAVKNLSVLSLFIFLIVVSLFMIYIVEIDHLINLEQLHETGNQAIYNHYAILFGLSFITVGLGTIPHFSQFPIFFLYLGIFLFMIGVNLNNRYNKASHKLTRKIFLPQYLLIVLGMTLSFIFKGSSFICTALVAVILLAIAVQVVTFNVRKTSAISTQS